jgi:hypothetical protein
MNITRIAYSTLSLKFINITAYTLAVTLLTVLRVSLYTLHAFRRHYLLMFQMYFSLPNIVNPYEVRMLCSLFAIIPVGWILNPLVTSSFADATSGNALKTSEMPTSVFALVVPPWRSENASRRNRGKRIFWRRLLAQRQKQLNEDTSVQTLSPARKWHSPTSPWAKSIKLSLSFGTDSAKLRTAQRIFKDPGILKTCGHQQLPGMYSSNT